MSGAAVSWSSKRQATTAGSSCEAEYIAAGSATSEALWLRAFLGELGGHPQQATLIASDSESAIRLAHDPVYHERTKHIDIKQHAIREHVERSEVDLVFVPTAHQVADVLTKGVPVAKHEFCVEHMGLGGPLYQEDTEGQEGQKRRKGKKKGGQASQVGVSTLAQAVGSNVIDWAVAGLDMAVGWGM